MLKDGEPIGAITMAWPDPGPTPQRQVDLLNLFAEQAVIAIDNVRLTTETREALERQTATADVLQVISESMEDARPVFDKILESCQRLFAGTQLGISLVGDDGMMHLGAHRGSAREVREQHSPRPSDHSPLKTKPTNRKMRSTWPASWKYILRSFSSICGRPAKALVFRTHESESTMRRPPMTERLRRKKLRSKMSP